MSSESHVYAIRQCSSLSGPVDFKRARKWNSFSAVSSHVSYYVKDYLEHGCEIVEYELRERRRFH